MKVSIANAVRALAVLLLFVPAPLAAVGTSPAYADVGGTAELAQPAVEVPEEAEAEEEEPWTVRFLAPAYYVVRIRGRYRVVQ